MTRTSTLLLGFTYFASLYDSQIPQHGFHWPCKALIDTPGIAVLNGDKVLYKRHTRVRTNACQYVPPTMQLEEETPG